MAIVVRFCEMFRVACDTMFRFVETMTTRCVCDLCRQVNNWFINARVRLWRPLLEELCCELRQEDHDFRHVKRKLFVLRPEEHGSAVQGN